MIELEFIGIITIPEANIGFDLREKFISNKSLSFGVDLENSNFYRWFLSRGGKFDDPISEHTLHYADLLRNSCDDYAIISELGGPIIAESTLSDIYYLVEKQANGQEGELTVDGKVNIFYVWDTADEARSVFLSYRKNTWLIGSQVLLYPEIWYKGGRVFFKNSILARNPKNRP